MTSVITSSTRIKVSSVLNKETKTYGKQNLIDKDTESCWNSDSGLPQSIILDFGRLTKAKEIKITFQGGFVGSEGQLSVQNSKLGGEYFNINKVYFDDINAKQQAEIKIAEMDDSIKLKGKVIEDGFDRLKIQFDKSTDFFGRVVVY
ncbi:hypothetical protein K502DRAFT_320238, partial [Neoconidiobolus thromboides FSU 785]